jgi:hypothetical protein
MTNPIKTTNRAYAAYLIALRMNSETVGFEFSHVEDHRGVMSFVFDDPLKKELGAWNAFEANGKVHVRHFVDAWTAITRRVREFREQQKEAASAPKRVLRASDSRPLTPAFWEVQHEATT